MKKVSRGTEGGRRVAPIIFRAAMRKANTEGAKDTTRRIVARANSLMRYGTFEGLDLEAARAVRDNGEPHLAAPCTYARTQFRAGVEGDMQRRIVEVHPKVHQGDLFWDKVGRFGSRAASGMTLEVLAVDVARVQDMTDADAMREGVAHVHVPTRFPLHARTPRGIFAWLWDQLNGAGSWAKNPWVWVYRYRVIPQNVDEILSYGGVAQPAGNEESRRAS